MIRYKSQRQLTLEGFETPFEMNLDPSNRWVKYANELPWDDLVKVYCRKMSSKMGAGAKDPRVVIGALFIKHITKLSDEDTIETIKENIYMQYFLGLSGYTYKKVFDPTLFVHIRERLGIKEFNEFTILLEECARRRKEQAAIRQATQMNEDKPKSEDNHDKSKDSKPSKTVSKSTDCQTKKTAPADQREDCVKLDEDGRKHKGDMLLDATACVADIKYPTDIDLLNASREKAEELIDIICERTKTKKPRTYRNVARKDYLEAIKRKNLGKKKRNKAIKKQIQYLERDIRHINKLLDNCSIDIKILDRSERKYFYVIQTVLYQQKEMQKSDTHSIEERMLSIHQPHVRAIPRGKSRSKTEFGSKIDLSMHDGYGYIERFHWGAFNEGEDLQASIYNYYMRNGYYPSRVFIDKIYATKENLEFLKSMHIQFIGLPLGKAKAEYIKAQKELLKGLCIRNEVEGRFGLDKRKYGMDLIKARTDITSQSWIGASNFIANFMNFMAEVLFVLIRKRLRRAQNLFFGPFMPSRLVMMPTSRSLNLQVVERGPCTSCSITQNIGLFQ